MVATKQKQRLTATDVLDSTKWYTGDELARLLGIAYADLAKADAAGRFRGYRKSVPTQYHAEDVLAWLAAENVPHQVTAAAIEEYEASRRPAEPPPPPQPSAAELAAAEAARRADERAQAERDDKARAMRFYVEILSRNSSPGPGDADTLVNVMRDLNISPEQMQADLQRLNRARRMQALHDDLQRAEAELVATRQAYDEMTCRHRLEEDAADKAKRNAYARVSDCSMASTHLNTLCRQAPYLFEEGSNPPRLLAGGA